MSKKNKLRAPDIRKILVKKYSSSENTLLHELTLPTNQTVADFIVVNDCINGFEIKSDVDTFVRLPKQIEGYDSICQFNWIVIGESKQKNIKDYVPEYWGIVVVLNENGQGKYRILRKAGRNNQWSYQNLLCFLPSVNLKRFAKTIPEMLEVHSYKKSMIQKMAKWKIIEEIMALSTFDAIKGQIMSEVIEYLKSSELKEKRELNSGINKHIRDMENKDKIKEREYRLHSFEYLDEELKRIKAKKKTREKAPRTIDLMSNYNYLLRDLNRQYLPLCLEYNNKGIHLAWFEFEDKTNEIQLIVEDKRKNIVVRESKQLWEILSESIEKSYNLRKTKDLLKSISS